MLRRPHDPPPPPPMDFGMGRGRLSTAPQDPSSAPKLFLRGKRSCGVQRRPVCEPVRGSLTLTSLPHSGYVYISLTLFFFFKHFPGRQRWPRATEQPLGKSSSYLLPDKLSWSPSLSVHLILGCRKSHQGFVELPEGSGPGRPGTEVCKHPKAGARGRLQLPAATARPSAQA